MQEEKQSRIGRGTVIELGIVGMIAMGIFYIAMEIGSTKTNIATFIQQWTAAKVETRLTTIEVTSANTDHRLSNIETEIKALSRRAASAPSSLIRPTSAEEREARSFQQLLLPPPGSTQ